MSTRMRLEVELSTGLRLFQFEDGRLFVSRWDDDRREIKEEKELIVLLMQEIEE